MKLVTYYSQDYACIIYAGLLHTKSGQFFSLWYSVCQNSNTMDTLMIAIWISDGCRLLPIVSPDSSCQPEWEMISTNISVTALLKSLHVMLY